MAFGLFKKKNTADIIYMNGHIYTQDPALPWATAAACKDGRVMAVGDFEGMEEITGEDTQVVDLKEQYMFPGFIEVHNTDILKAFENLYLAVDPVWDLDTVLEAVSEYAEETDREVVFGYGYGEHILADYDDPEEVQALLDEAERERPVLILGASGVHCWYNTLAAQIIEEVMENEGMTYLSADVILQILAPLDFEEVEKAVIDSANQLCDRGITSVFPLNTPEYFAAQYQDCLVALIGESYTPKQRLFSGLFINRPLMPELVVHKLSAGRTNCIELGGLITCDFLKGEINTDEELGGFSEEALRKICQAAADKGYHIHLDAVDREAAEMAAETFRHLRKKGCKNNIFVLASGISFEDDEQEGTFMTTWETDYLNASVYSHAKSVSEAIELLTTGAARLLGVSDDFGIIEQGKKADFTVFEENPLDKNLRYFSGMHASMTVVDSQIVYDLESACDEEMYDLLVSMRL